MSAGNLAEEARIAPVRAAGTYAYGTSRRKLRPAVPGQPASQPKRRGPKPRPAECGSPDGAMAHYRRGEKACPACARARSAARREYRPPRLPGDEAARQFGAVMRTARKASGLTQRQLGGMVGLSNTSVSAVEAAKQDPGIAKVLAIAAVLGIDLNALSRGDGPRQSHEVTVRSVFEASCGTCAGVIGTAVTYAEVTAIRREHVSRYQEGAAAYEPLPPVPDGEPS